MQAAWADWTELRLADLQFAQLPLAQRVAVGLIGLAVAALALRFTIRASAHRGRVALPALVGAGAEAGREKNGFRVNPQFKEELKQKLQ